jgi:hypothetical protein
VATRALGAVARVFDDFTLEAVVPFGRPRSATRATERARNCSRPGASEEPERAAVLPGSAGGVERRMLRGRAQGPEAECCPEEPAARVEALAHLPPLAKNRMISCNEMVVPAQEARHDGNREETSCGS